MLIINIPNKSTQESIRGLSFKNLGESIPFFLTKGMPRVERIVLFGVLLFDVTMLSVSLYVKRVVNR
jgi:hypothetical protein